MNTTNNKKLQDFELIKKIENKELKIEELDNDTKVRLIKLIAERSESLEDKIKNMKDKNKKISKKLSKGMKK